jgi:hypothetical protein
MENVRLNIKRYLFLVLGNLTFLSVICQGIYIKNYEQLGNLLTQKHWLYSVDGVIFLKKQDGIVSKSVDSMLLRYLQHKPTGGDYVQYCKQHFDSSELRETAIAYRSVY